MDKVLKQQHCPKCSTRLIFLDVTERFVNHGKALKRYYCPNNDCTVLHIELYLPTSKVDADLLTVESFS